MRLSNGAWFFWYTATFSLLIFAYFSVFPIHGGSSGAVSESIVTEEFFPGDSIATMPKDGLSSAPATASGTVGKTVPTVPEKPYAIVRKASGTVAESYEALTEKILSSRFFSVVGSTEVEIVDDRTEPRGKMHKQGISLIASIASSSEYAKILVHELAHVIDVNRFVPASFSADPSDEFYAVSWNSAGEKKTGMAVDDFVSGYALSNRYEDFAESVAFYVFHNDEFKRRSARNASLAAKYDFISRKVFPNAEFQGTSFTAGNLPEYAWDVTKLPIDLNKYLFFIR